MSADFTPTMHGYTGQGAFKFWCQKVLPLVYDDSLSYYELLCKVVNYLNNVISDVSATESNVQSLYDSFVALQNYVNEYFDNLDVTEAVHDNVNEAFNEYTESDTFKALVDDYVNDYLNEYAEQLVDESVELKIDDSVAEQIDGVVAEQLPELVNTSVPTSVTNWLDTNVDPVGSAVVVDSSLSISGAAADAKATGMADSSLRSSQNLYTNTLYEFYENVPINTDITGYYALNTGVGNAIGSWSESDSYAQTIIESQEGERFSVYGTSGSSPRLWAFLDENDIILAVANANIIVSSDNPIIVTAPNMTAKAVFTVHINHQFGVKKPTPKYAIKDSEIDAELEDHEVRIEGLESHYYESINVNSFEWHTGLINYEGQATDDSNNTRIRTEVGRYVEKGCTIVANSGYTFAVFVYKSEFCRPQDVYDDDKHALSEHLTSYRTINSGWLKICIRKTNDTAFTDDLNTEANAAITISGVTSIKRGIDLLYKPSKMYYYSGTIDTQLLETAPLLDTYYSAFDSLMALHPNYMKDEILGSDESGQYDIKAYTIQSNQSTNENAIKPKIIWISNIHGEEKQSKYCTYYMAKELLENTTDPCIEMLRANAVFVFIPACNPWGVNNPINGRFNSRGVNLNRNFNANWEESGEPWDFAYGGTAPESEEETKVIADYLRANRGSLVVVNKHDCDPISTNQGRIGYFVNDWYSDQAILNSILNQMDSKLRTEFPWIVNGQVVGSDLDTAEKMLVFKDAETASKGSMDKYYSMLGLHGGLIEVVRGCGDLYTQEHPADIIKMHINLSINYLTCFLLKNRDVYSDTTPINEYTVI